jgi:hypothetical protein
MSFSRFMKPTTLNIVYTGSHENLAPTSLANVANQDKMLCNDTDGNLQWKGYNAANLALRLNSSGKIDPAFLTQYVSDVFEFPDFASFPAVGEKGKIYLDASQVNKAYRWADTMYFLITDLSDYFNTAQINTMMQNETLEREMAEASLQDDIDGEILNRTNANTSLSNRINPLETLKTNADAAFNLTGATVVVAKNIDMNTKTITNCPTLTTITTNFTSADTTLSNRITPLETHKTNADASFTLTGTNVVMAKNIDMGTKTITNCPTLTTITTNYTSADTGLSNRINPLETFKTYSDLNFNLADASNFKIIRPLDMTTNAILNCPTITTITTNISNEIINRTSADSSLQSQINTINTNAFMKNATGTTTIGSLIDCNGNSIINCNIMHCGSLKTGSINTEAGTYIASVTTAGLDFNYGKNIYLDNNRTGRESNSCIISANFFDALDSLCITGKGNAPWAHDRRIYLQDIVTVRDEVKVPTLNTKTCDGAHRLTRPDIYTDTATVTGSNFFEYASLSGYKIYHVQWFVGTAPQFSGWSLSTDGTYTSINVSMTAGQTIRCVVLMCQN